MEDQQLFFSPFVEHNKLHYIKDLHTVGKVPTGPDSAQPLKKQVTPPHQGYVTYSFWTVCGFFNVCTSFVNFLSLYSKILHWKHKIILDYY